jgi:hypothetical protein
LHVERFINRQPNLRLGVVLGGSFAHSQHLGLGHQNAPDVGLIASNDRMLGAPDGAKFVLFSSNDRAVARPADYQSQIVRELATSPVMVSAFRVEDRLNISVDCLEDAHFREHHRTAIFGGVHQPLDSGLPFRSVVF